MRKIPVFLLFAVLVMASACQSTSSKPTAAGEGSFTEKHIDFARWNRGPDCCTAHGREVAVASGGTNASKAGVEVYEKGGNLVDAAVAVAFCLAVERPHSLGLGGGGFLTLHLAGAKPQEAFVDFRETAPGKASRDMYLDAQGKVIPGASLEGGLAIATPGFVAGMYDLHKKWGKLPWKAVLAPAIRLAREGFVIYPSLGQHIGDFGAKFAKDPYLKSLFFKSDGTPLKAGDKLVQADLARTIEEIARHGKQVFYTGALAHRIAAYVKRNKGILDLRDLRSYKVKFTDPIRVSYPDFTVITAPPPSAGGVMLVEMLNILKGYDLRSLSASPVKYTQLLSEVMKRGYADRSHFISDPDFVKRPYHNLMTQSYADSVRPRLGLAHSTPSREIQPPTAFPEDHGTTHMSLLDNQGNAVSSTLTINDSFGAVMAVPGTGVILNDEMDDFSAKVGEQNVYGLTSDDANAIAPGKRPVSSMMPTIILKKDEPVLAVGGAGGSRIMSSVIQVILNDLFVRPGQIRDAVFAARAHQQWVPDRLDLEDGYPEETRERLRAMGNEIAPWPWQAQVQAVGKVPGELTAVFDPRDEGGAAAR